MEEKDIYAELSSIRNLMERSSKFISLSGLSGIMAGFYALVGAFIGYKVVYADNNGIAFSDNYVNDPDAWKSLFFIAAIVLVFSLFTVVWLTIRQARKKGEVFWNPVSRRLLTNLSIPLIAGGLFILILIFRGYYEIIISASLLFYGMALIIGSQYTFTDVKWLGVCEIALGLLAALIPAFGLIFWTIGFGILHMLYGSIMHFKYSQ